MHRRATLPRRRTAVRRPVPQRPAPALSPVGSVSGRARVARRTLAGARRAPGGESLQDSVSPVAPSTRADRHRLAGPQRAVGVALQTWVTTARAESNATTRRVPSIRGGAADAERWPTERRSGRATSGTMVGRLRPRPTRHPRVLRSRSAEPPRAAARAQPPTPSAATAPTTGSFTANPSIAVKSRSRGEASARSCTRAFSRAGATGLLQAEGWGGARCHRCADDGEAIPRSRDRTAPAEVDLSKISDHFE